MIKMIVIITKNANITAEKNRKKKVMKTPISKNMKIYIHIRIVVMMNCIL